VLVCASRSSFPEALKGKLERFTFAELDWPMEQTKARKVLAEIFGHQATLLTISGGMMWDLFLTTEVYTGIADQVTNRLTYLDTIYQGIRAGVQRLGFTIMGMPVQPMFLEAWSNSYADFSSPRLLMAGGHSMARICELAFSSQCSL